MLILIQNLRALLDSWVAILIRPNFHCYLYFKLASGISDQPCLSEKMDGRVVLRFLSEQDHKNE